MKKYMCRLFLACFVLSGCAGIPFEPVQLSSVENLDVRIVRNNFEEKLATQFSVVESAVINYRGREMTALGYSEVDEKEDSLAVAGVTPVGVKLFEVKAVKGDLKYSFSFPQIKKSVDHQKIAEAVAEDIRRIYMGRLPSAEAEVFKLKDRICYRQPSGKGELEFFFGGNENVLLEKRYKEGRRQIWSVRYFEYRDQNSKIYPSKIFFKHNARKYKVTLRLKEILV